MGLVTLGSGIVHLALRGTYGVIEGLSGVLGLLQSVSCVRNGRVGVGHIVVCGVDIGLRVVHRGLGVAVVGLRLRLLSLGRVEVGLSTLGV